MSLTKKYMNTYGNLNKVKSPRKKKTEKKKSSIKVREAAKKVLF